MNRKQLIIVILVAFFVGAFGSIVLGRFAIPYLASFKHLSFLNRISSSSPIVINRKEVVQLNDGANLIDLAKQASNITVSFYSMDTNPVFLGNGCIMTSDGLIFSTKGVIGTRTQVRVALTNGEIYKALVRALDPKSDIVALTVEKKDLNPASFAQSLDLGVGQRVITVGESNRPFIRSFATGFVTNTVLNTTTQLGRTFSTEVLEGTFETDAAIDSGRFAGSPIINLDGNLSGMVSGTSPVKIILAENLQTALSSYLAGGKITRPRLGLTYLHLSKSLAILRGFDRAGVLAVKADDGSPAAGKLLPNDLIIQVNGQGIENDSFEQLIQRHAIGEIRLGLIRNKKEMEIKINLVPTK